MGGVNRCISMTYNLNTHIKNATFHALFSKSFFGKPKQLARVMCMFIIIFMCIPAQGARKHRPFYKTNAYKEIRMPQKRAKKASANNRNSAQNNSVQNQNSAQNNSAGSSNATQSSNDEKHKQDNSKKKEPIAIKNNLLYDAILTPNLQLEVQLPHNWSIEFGAGFNPFPLDDTKFPKWRHLSLSIAPRYWFCNVFNRDFISFNAAYAFYNVAGSKFPIGWMYKQVLDHRYEGHAIMGGASYGWHFPISPHFSIELEAGIEAGYTWFDEYECKHCGKKTAQSGHWFLLPKAGINLVVPLGSDEESLARRCDCEKVEEKQEEPKDTVVTPVEPVIAVVDTVTPPITPIEPEEPLPAYIPAHMLKVDIAKNVRPIVPFVPYFEVKADEMMRLRSRILRNEEEYEPYDPSMALSADPRNVFIYFDVNVTKMDRSFIENDKLMDSIMHILRETIEDNSVHISHIQIVGFASFDGRLSYNERLAASRAQTIKEYMQSLFPIPDSVFAICNGGESWAELKYQLEKVDFLGQKQVLEIIESEPDYEMREKKIKALNGGKTYIYMRDELKRILRNLGCITIYIEN